MEIPLQSVIYQIWLNSASGEHRADILKAQPGHNPPPPLLAEHMNWGRGGGVSPVPAPSSRALVEQGGNKYHLLQSYAVRQLPPSG